MNFHVPFSSCSNDEFIANLVLTIHSFTFSTPILDYFEDSLKQVISTIYTIFQHKKQEFVYQQFDITMLNNHWKLT